MNKGKLYGVSVGPGDPELMTLKAVRIVKECQVVACPETEAGNMLAFDIAKGAVDMEGKEILPLKFKMTRDKQEQLDQHGQIANQVKELLDDGKNVALLNLGDVSLYSTFTYIADLLKGDYEVISIAGVTSYSAAAAVLGISLTDINSPVHIIPGSTTSDNELALPGTKIFMKNKTALPELIEKIKQTGRAKNASIVQNCGLSNQYACLEIDKAEPLDSYFSLIIVRE